MDDDSQNSNPNGSQPPRRPRGRPKLELTDAQLDELEKLGGLACTMHEAAAWFGVSPDSLERRFKAEPERYAKRWREGQLKGKASLRRLQYAAAAGTPDQPGIPGRPSNPTMLIWLGKQWLGQRDVVINEHAGSIDLRGGALEKLAGVLDRLATFPTPAELEEESPRTIN